MSKHHYACIKIENPDERTSVDALVHDSASTLFATGVADFNGNVLRWRTDATGRLRAALTSLNSYKDPLGAARRLVRRVDEVSNGG